MNSLYSSDLSATPHAVQCTWSMEKRFELLGVVGDAATGIIVWMQARSNRIKVESCKCAATVQYRIVFVKECLMHSVCTILGVVKSLKLKLSRISNSTTSLEDRLWLTLFRNHCR